MNHVAQLNQPKHDHHLHEGAALRSAAKERLTSQGEQWTGMRAAVQPEGACDQRSGLLSSISKELGPARSDRKSVV